MMRFCRVSVCCTCIGKYRLKGKTMQVIVAPFLVLRRLQIGNFVVFFFFFCLPVFTRMRTRLRAPHNFFFPESGSHQLG